VEIQPEPDAPEGEFRYPVSVGRKEKAMTTQQMQLKVEVQSCRPKVSLAFIAWVAQPEATVYTGAEWIGDPTGELATAAAEAEASAGGKNPWDVPAFCQPEIEPEEFESVYNWFLS
jgi:hypothetical protein